jgi:hypothetical protein
MAADALLARSLRTRCYLVLGLFVVVVLCNVIISVQNNARRESHLALEAERQRQAEEVLLETQEKREQASRLLSEVEKIAKIEHPQASRRPNRPNSPRIDAAPSRESPPWP